MNHVRWGSNKQSSQGSLVDTPYFLPWLQSWITLISCREQKSEQLQSVSVEGDNNIIIFIRTDIFSAQRKSPFVVNINFDIDFAHLVVTKEREKKWKTTHQKIRRNQSRDWNYPLRFSLEKLAVLKFFESNLLCLQTIHINNDMHRFFILRWGRGTFIDRFIDWLIDYFL